MILRDAVAADAPAISALILELAPLMTVDGKGEGAAGFLLSLAPAAIAAYIAAPNYRYQLGFLDGALAGVVAVRDGRHVFHLFVARALHGRGLARRLWAAARTAAGDADGYTVNSSCYALPMYEHFGFVASGPRVEKDGIAFVPMRLAALAGR